MPLDRVLLAILSQEKMAKPALNGPYYNKILRYISIFCNGGLIELPENRFAATYNSMV